MQKSTKYVLWGIVLVVVAAVIFNQVSEANAEPGRYDELAQCISNSGAKFYGAYDCIHCLNQKKMFESSAEYLPYVECKINGDNYQGELCDAQGIEATPTWIFADGTRQTGSIPLRRLAALTNCPFPENAN